MITLNENYSKNIEVLKENLKRGMKKEQADNIINSFTSQFINSDKYGIDEKHFINEMKKEVIKYFNVKTVKVTELAKKMGIEVIEK